MDLMETCIELNLEFIEESGGVVSWLKRLYTTEDDGVAHGLERDITNGVHSEEHRSRLLHVIDDFIKETRETRGAEHGGTLRSYVRTGVDRRTNAIRAYIQRLEAVRAKVASLRVKK